MSYYSDATIADLADVLSLIGYSPQPVAMVNRFLQQNSDADLIGVLQDMATDAAGLTYIRGWSAFAQDFRAAVDALQAIEDHHRVTVTVQLDQAGGTLEVESGGTDVVFP